MIFHISYIDCTASLRSVQYTQRRAQHGAARTGVHMHALSQTHTHFISLQNQFLSSTIRDERKSIERNKMKITTKTYTRAAAMPLYLSYTYVRRYPARMYSSGRSHIRINTTVDATNNRKTQNKIEERKRNEEKKNIILCVKA